MKRILLVILVVCMCLCLFSCGDDEVPDGMFLASNTDIVDYKLFAPEGWNVVTADRATTHIYASNSDRTNVLVMQWNVTENTKTVADWWEKEYKPQVFTAEAVKNVTVEKNKDGTEGVPTTLGAKPATKYVYTGKIGDAFFKYEVIACVTKGSIYVMQITYMQDNELTDGRVTYSAQELHAQSIAKIVENFRFN